MFTEVRATVLKFWILLGGASHIQCTFVYCLGGIYVWLYVGKKWDFLSFLWSHASNFHIPLHSPL